MNNYYNNQRPRERGYNVITIGEEFLRIYFRRGERGLHIYDSDFVRHYTVVYSLLLFMRYLSQSVVLSVALTKIDSTPRSDDKHPSV